MLAEGRAHAATVLHLSYRAPASEPDFQKTFDFSRAALAGRWEAGARDMAAAPRTLASRQRRAARAAEGLAVRETGR